jgi:hypothetical protein
MPTLQCTLKLLKELGVAPSPPADSGGGLGSWHANLLRFDRRKCILFTNDETLYSVFVPGVRKPQFQQIQGVFAQAVFRSLRLGGFRQRQIEAVLEAIDVAKELRFTKTGSRSVLGSMNDLAFQLEWLISEAGGLEGSPIDDFNQRINRTPMSAIRPHVYSIDALRAVLDEITA